MRQFSEKKCQSRVRMTLELSKSESLVITGQHSKKWSINHVKNGVVLMSITFPCRTACMQEFKTIKKELR